MARSDQVLTACIAAATSAACVLAIGVTFFTGQVLAERTEAGANTSGVQQGNLVDRTHKSDPLPVARSTTARTPVATVEIVGVRNAAIVYRDRSGNILFKTDPVANVTVVAKNVELPELTLRETAASEVVRMPLEARQSKPLSGCESAFARPSPESLTERNDRCLATHDLVARRFAAAHGPGHLAK